jgi:hypothetical protein
MTGGTLAARSSLTRAKRKLEQNPTPAQRGAVTRAKKYAAASYDRNTQPRKFGRPGSVMRKRPPEMPARWGVKGGGGKAGAVAGKAVKLSPSQRMVAQRAKEAFKDDTLLINGRLAKGYTESVQAVQKKFGVSNRIATKVFMKHGFRMGTSDIQYVDPARAKRTIKAIRATTKVGARLGGQMSRKELNMSRKIRIKRRASAAVPITSPSPARKAPSSLRLPTLKGVMKPPRIKLQGEGGAALRKVMSGVPTVPKGRRPLSKDKAGQMLDVGFDRPMRMGGRERSALEKELKRQRFSYRSDALGGVRTYSKQFAVGNKNPRTGAEIITVQVQSKGGPLVGGTVSTRRTVFAPSRQRNVGGRIMERAYGLPIKPRASTKPRRRPR